MTQLCYCMRRSDDSALLLHAEIKETRYMQSGCGLTKILPDQNQTIFFGPARYDAGVWHSPDCAVLH